MGLNNSLLERDSKASLNSPISRPSLTFSQQRRRSSSRRKKFALLDSDVDSIPRFASQPVILQDGQLASKLRKKLLKRAKTENLRNFGGKDFDSSPENSKHSLKKQKKLKKLAKKSKKEVKKSSSKAKAAAAVDLELDDGASPKLNTYYAEIGGGSGKEDKKKKKKKRSKTSDHKGDKPAAHWKSFKNLRIEDATKARQKIKKTFIVSSNYAGDLMIPTNVTDSSKNKSKDLSISPSYAGQVSPNLGSESVSNVEDSIEESSLLSSSSLTSYSSSDESSSSGLDTDSELDVFNAMKKKRGKLFTRSQTMFGNGTRSNPNILSSRAMMANNSMTIRSVGANSAALPLHPYFNSRSASRASFGNIGAYSTPKKAFLTEPVGEDEMQAFELESCGNLGSGIRTNSNMEIMSNIGNINGRKSNANTLTHEESILMVNNTLSFKRGSKGSNGQIRDSQGSSNADNSNGRRPLADDIFGGFGHDENNSNHLQLMQNNSQYSAEHPSLRLSSNPQLVQALPMKLSSASLLKKRDKNRKRRINNGSDSSLSPPTTIHENQEHFYGSNFENRSDADSFALNASRSLNQFGSSRPSFANDLGENLDNIDSAEQLFFERNVPSRATVLHRLSLYYDLEISEVEQRRIESMWAYFAHDTSDENGKGNNDDEGDDDSGNNNSKLRNRGVNFAVQNSSPKAGNLLNTMAFNDLKNKPDPEGRLVAGAQMTRFFDYCGYTAHDQSLIREWFPLFSQDGVSLSKEEMKQVVAVVSMSNTGWLLSEPTVVSIFRYLLSHGQESGELQQMLKKRIKAHPEAAERLKDMGFGEGDVPLLGATSKENERQIHHELGSEISNVLVVAELAYILKKMDARDYVKGAEMLMTAVQVRMEMIGRVEHVDLEQMVHFLILKSKHRTQEEL